MARSLPENTVDAWTAIELARNGARWIWLPTTNQGAARTGSHPGDVSTVLGRRILIIENKGVEARVAIQFGSSGYQQRQFLKRVEDAGLAAAQSNIGPSNLPTLGWVFYGLPLIAGGVDGTDWSQFPSWHFLVCPHDLDHAGLGVTSANLTSVASAVFKPACIDHRLPVLAPFPRLCRPLRLDWLAGAVHRGLAGLPLAGSSSEARSQLRELISAVRGAAESDIQPSDISGDNFSDFEGETVFDLLRNLAAAAASRARHLVVALV